MHIQGSALGWGCGARDEEVSALTQALGKATRLLHILSVKTFLGIVQSFLDGF